MVSKMTSKFLVLALNSVRLGKSPVSVSSFCSVRNLSLTSAKNDLMEFFDSKKNWGEKEIRVGRSWKVDELRLKSNADLHKLWYVLLKEKNMLLTMEADAKTEAKYFPNPERIDKVEESMENLETVVRERNKAYFQLETGKTGERTGEEVENWMGLPEYREYKEYSVPKEQNKNWYIEKAKEPQSSPQEKQKYFAMVREYQKKRKNRLNRLEIYKVMEALKLYPNIDVDALREKYPTIDDGQFQRIVERVRDKNWENNVVPWREKVWRGRFTSFKRLTYRKWYRL